MNWIRNTASTYLSEIVAPPVVHTGSRSAVVVIDVQHEFCSPGGWADRNGLDYTYCHRCVEPINTLVDAAHTKGVPVFWVKWGLHGLDSFPKNQFYMWKKKPSEVGLEAGVFQSGTPGVRLLPELHTHPHDTVLEKDRISGFAGTCELHSTLKSRGIKQLFFAGLNTDQCVLTSMADANMLGYDTIMVKECCVTSSPKYVEEAAYYNAALCFGRVMSLSQVVDFNVVDVEKLA